MDRALRVHAALVLLACLEARQDRPPLLHGLDGPNVELPVGDRLADLVPEAEVVDVPTRHDHTLLAVEPHASACLVEALDLRGHAAHG